MNRDPDDVLRGGQGGGTVDVSPPRPAPRYSLIVPPGFRLAVAAETKRPVLADR